MKLRIKVIPNASRDEVVGWMNEVLKIKVRAVPEKGRANAAVQSLLAGILGIPERDVEVVAGHASRLKTVEITVLTAAEVTEKLSRS